MAEVIEVAIFVFLAVVNIPAAMVSIFIIAIMQRAPGLELANRTLSTVSPGCSINIRDNKFRSAVRAGLIVLCLTLPLAFMSMQLCLAIAILFGAAWFFTPVSYTYLNHNRLLQTWKGNAAVQVHLRNMDQRFDKRTYAELMEILTHPLQGVERILLESPMFYSCNGCERDMSQIRTYAEQRGWHLSHRPAKLGPLHLLAVVIMALTDAKSRKLNLMKWLRLEFTRL
jgi:hypothetical protein